MDSRCINKNDLTIGARYDALDLETGRLRLVRNSRNLFADQAIEESRFSGVGTADKSDVATTEFGFGH